VFTFCEFRFVPRCAKKPAGNFEGFRGQTGPSGFNPLSKNLKTTMKLSLKPLVLSFAASLGLALSAAAQGSATSSGMTTTAPATGSAYGLLGQNYAGVYFGYTDLDGGPPDVARSYGFVANRPSEVPNVDALFKYEYSRVSAFGIKGREHDLAIGAVGYLPLSGVKPFIEGNVGWAFTKVGGAKSDSFFYLIGVGVEIQVLPRLALTPYVNYQEAPHFNAHQWGYGAKATYRLAQEWSTTAAIELSDDHDLTYRLGVNRHF